MEHQSKKLFTDLQTSSAFFLNLSICYRNQPIYWFFEIDYPNLSPESLELLVKLAFVHFNLNYWLLRSYLIKSSHEAYLKDRLQSKNLF